MQTLNVTKLLLTKLFDNVFGFFFFIYFLYFISTKFCLNVGFVHVESSEKG